MVFLDPQTRAEDQVLWTFVEIWRTPLRLRMTAPSQAPD